MRAFAGLCLAVALGFVGALLIALCLDNRTPGWLDVLMVLALFVCGWLSVKLESWLRTTA